MIVDLLYVHLSVQPLLPADCHLPVLLASGPGSGLQRKRVRSSQFYQKGVSWVCRWTDRSSLCLSCSIGNLALALFNYALCISLACLWWADVRIIAVFFPSTDYLVKFLISERWFCSHKLFYFSLSVCSVIFLVKLKSKIFVSPFAKWDFFTRPFIFFSKKINRFL